MNYPKSRLRRLRYNNNIRSLVQDVHLNISDLIYPIFICEGENIKEEIKSLPGQYRLSVDNVLVLCDELIKLGIKSILLFGISDKKDNDGSIACSEDSIIPFAIKKIKKKFSTDILIMADLCNCSYTSQSFTINTKRGIQLDASNSTINVDASTTLTYAGIIVHQGSETNNGYTKSGGGTFALSGNSTYSGVTTISAGVITIAHAGSLGSTSGVTSITSGAALSISGGITVAEPITVNGTGVSSDRKSVV